MDASTLLELGSPGDKGLVTAEEWLLVEAEFGRLPDDYKSIISLFGHGSFGFFVLFHPFVSDRTRRLPDAEKEFMRMLNQYAEGLRDFLQLKPRLLAFGPERHLVAFADGQWWHVDLEYEHPNPIGRSLVAFLHGAYQTSQGRAASIEIGHAIWGSGDSFFESASIL